MSVLREQLNQAEEERFELKRRSTELSATVTSTLASYAFLEQTLASETNKYVSRNAFWLTKLVNSPKLMDEIQNFVHTIRVQFSLLTINCDLCPNKLLITAY